VSSTAGDDRTTSLSIASAHCALYGLGDLSVGEDERDAVIDLAGLRLFAYERGDLVAGCERPGDELAAEAAGRSEDCELHVGAGPSNAGTPSAIGSVATP
jgi:hypothetical protein